MMLIVYRMPPIKLQPSNFRAGFFGPRTLCRCRHFLIHSIHSCSSWIEFSQTSIVAIFLQGRVLFLLIKPFWSIKVVIFVVISAGIYILLLSSHQVVGIVSDFILKMVKFWQSFANIFPMWRNLSKFFKIQTNNWNKWKKITFSIIILEIQLQIGITNCMKWMKSYMVMSCL